MMREEFNSDWAFCIGELAITDKNGSGAQRLQRGITLPHDAMIHEERHPDAVNGNVTGFYPGNTYTYLKHFFVPEIWRTKDVYLEFEGVYMYASVFLNSNFVTKRPYGYSGFSMLLNDYLIYGAENTLTVIAKTGQQRTGRWYSGAGIYRDVHICVCDPLHIKMDGVRIRTAELDAESACVLVDIEIENNCREVRKISVFTEIIDSDGQVVQAQDSMLTTFGNTQTPLRQRLLVNSPHVWSCEQPTLYRCHIRLLEEGAEVDTAEEYFGIRQFQLDPEHGLRVNGTPVKLRGACIHHDNGIIGACTLPRAEQRRCEQLKEAGFNCIRSAHNPISRAMLEACDRMGMLVIDEAYDGWNKAKIDHDSSLYFNEWWQEDLKAMIRKDFNHPSVVIYSLGNEIKEAGTPQGARQFRYMAEFVRDLDETRYITASISGLFIMYDQLPIILQQLEDHPTESATLTIHEETQLGSDDINSLLAQLHTGAGDLLFNHPLLKERTEEFFAVADIAGMNYMTECFEKDHQLYPHRIILSAESFPADIAHVWEAVERNPYVIGDMTWAGYDYIGEAGCGIYHYDGKKNFSSNWPDRLGYIADIDLIGERRPISYLRQIVYGLRKQPYIAVERLDKYGMPVSLTPWMGKDDIASWTWPGYEGKPAKIQVFSASQEVELYLNERIIGRKKTGKKQRYINRFEIEYEPGLLTAIGYTEGREDGRVSLQSAGEAACIQAEADRRTITADGKDLCYIKACICDEQGRVTPFVSMDITVQLEGPGILQGYGSADPQQGGCYSDACWPTFNGYVLAAIRATRYPGTITATFLTDGLESCSIRVISIEKRSEPRLEESQ